RAGARSARPAGTDVTNAVRRQVVTTRRVRRSVTVRLTPARAIRVGVKLLIGGLRAAPRRRPVHLTLRAARSEETTVASSDDAVEEPGGTVETAAASMQDQTEVVTQ
ncbi:MAG TPA: hypothetical protein VEY67_02320, partial [Candidatus Dormibacteraeota bacterium]|nr:hypothetical protein [Candidatus Dormibacteraeota bacterium]